MTEQPDVEKIVWRIAAFGLPDGDRAHQAHGPQGFGEESWTKALALLESHRITGFALAAAEDGWLDLSAEQATALLEAHRQAMLVPLGIERGLLKLASAFDAENVDFVVLKGPAVAHTVYPDPSWRYFGDIDLLVRTEGWRKATAVLQDLGFRRSLPEPRGGFDERFGSAAQFHREGDIEVDLHRNLVLGPIGLWMDSEVLFERATEFRLWDRTFRRLDDTLLQLHACIHAALGSVPPLTVPVRDVAQVAHFARVDWEALAEDSARWKLGAVVRHAFRTASEILGISLPAGAQRAAALTPTRKERRALEAYVTDRRTRGGTALFTLRAIPGLRAKAAYLRGLIFPGREFLAARYGPRASYRQRWAVPFRWLSGRFRSA